MWAGLPTQNSKTRLHQKKKQMHDKCLHVNFSVWTQVMNRTQQRLELVLIPLDNFCESCGSVTSSPNGDHSWKSPLGKTTTPIQVNRSVHRHSTENHFVVFHIY